MQGILVNGYKRFEGSYCLHVQGLRHIYMPMMEKSIPDTLILIYQTTRHRIPEHSEHNACEKIKVHAFPCCTQINQLCLAI